MICKYHFERTRQQVEASHLIDGEWMCDRCYKGASFSPERKFLSKATIREIKQKLDGGASPNELSNEYDVDYAIVWDIKSGRKKKALETQ